MHYEFHTEREGRRSLSAVRRHPWFVVAGIATTLVLHAAVVVPLVVGMSSETDQPEEEPEDSVSFEDVELLKLGEKKPDDQLPRIANPAPPTPKEETVTLDDDEEPPEETKKREPERTQERTEKPPDEEAETKDPEEDLEEQKEKAFEDLHKKHRPTNEVTPEGREDGTKGGTTTDPDVANMIKTYQAKIWKALQEHWGIPKTVPEDEVDRLLAQARVYLEIDESGHVVSHRFLRKTENEQLNSTISRLIEEFTASGGGDTLPVPQKEKLRNKVLDQGLKLQNWQAVE